MKTLWIHSVCDQQYKALAYYEICPFAVHYKSVISYSTGPGECLPMLNVIVLSAIMLHVNSLNSVASLN